jgi:hypothetical protein
MSQSRAKFDPVAFCARPLIRRVYMGLAAGLAVFIATLAILREPFRGYLAEVQIVGPTAQGLDLNDAARWLKRTEPTAAILTGPLQGPIPRSRLRMTYLAPRPQAARLRLDDLATRWLYQYLPEHLQAHRRQVLSQSRNAVSTARDREDASRTRVEELRQQQLARYFQQPSLPRVANAPVEPLPAPPATAPQPLDSSGLRAQLDKLRMELSRLLASFTDEHPQVITLRQQIAGLEQQLGLPTTIDAGPQLRPAPVAGAAATSYLASAAGSPGAGETAATGAPADLSAELAAALVELSQASRQRQVAEQRQTDRMQELASEPTAADWSAQPAQIVTRLGGTPRSVTLALGALLAGVAGIVMFRASAAAVLPPKIESARELAAVLEIPVIGNAARLRTTAARIRRLFKPEYVRLAMHLAEGVIGLAAAACILSILVEPTLAAQVLADPFGTLSEVLGRLLGNP